MSHDLRLLPYAEWRALEAAHLSRVDRATLGHRERRLAGQKHAIEDFLFTYYPFTVSALRRWHPGAGVGLLADAGSLSSFGDRLDWRWYQQISTDQGPAITIDLTGFRTDRASGVSWIRAVLSKTLQKPARLSCFGLHEWAMVYGLKPGEQRHENLPLRLSHEQTDAVIRNHKIGCTHFDAFRFFTEPAAPLNKLQPTRATQSELEQPGCLHAGMDLYKWGTKLLPAIPSDLVMDAFDLAKEIRLVDMQASPYDVSKYGHESIAIETPAGKAIYVHRQTEFSHRGNQMRERYLKQLVLSTPLDQPPPPATRETP